MKGIRNIDAESVEDLISDYIYRCETTDFCAPVYGGGSHGHADADTLDVHARKYLSTRHIIAYTMAYLKRCGVPLDMITLIPPREIADAMARDGEAAYYAYVDAQEDEEEAA